MGLLGIKSAVLLAASALVSTTLASPAQGLQPVKLQARAVPNAPNGYVPTRVDCPSERPSIRSGSSLSPAERDWLPRRRNATVPAIRDFVSRAAIPGFDSAAYLANADAEADRLPNVGIAISGGGYRAMTAGAGAIAAFDSRTDGSTGAGHLGGLLQSATYLSGLSGGGWLVGSLSLNNFTSVQDIVDRNRIWQLEQSILEGPDDGPSMFDYYRDVFDAVDAKNADWEVSITDYWGRMLSYQFIEPEGGGLAYTFSSIASDDALVRGDVPMPLIVADGRYPGEKIIPTNCTIYEFNPWEMGSWDNTLNAFAPLRYVGSSFQDGELPDNETCLAGFDNAGFVLGTSSSLFNQFMLYIKNDTVAPEGVPDFFVDATVALLDAIGRDDDDIAEWSPNPFFGYDAAHNLNSETRRLTLVDGGEDLQNVPFYPHIQDARAVDVIFAVDLSADTEYGWPNGASPAATYLRSRHNISAGTSFPSVPDNNTFVNLGLNTRPTFFGCDARNATAPGADRPAPLVVYIPSYPYAYWANISTFTLSMTNSERNAMIRNGYEVATMANSTRDADWQVCAACAVMHRSWVRTNTDVPAKCEECFDKFCWDGTLDTSAPPPYEPTMFGAEVHTDESAAGRVGVGLAGVLVAALLYL